jgi:hypothetical protein
MASLGNEANKRVSSLDMLQEAILKCKDHNNEDEGYIELMGDAKREPFKGGKKNPKPLKNKTPSNLPT